MERSFSLGRPGGGNTIKLYEVDLSEATNISDIPSLNAVSEAELANIRPAQKRLLLDLNDLGLGNGLNNIEGITFGSKLPNGLQSLILVGDDNFNLGNIPQVPFLESTQFLVFEVDLSLPLPQLGTEGDDILLGGLGNDLLNCRVGDDTLSGINTTSISRSGLNEIDTLTGGSSHDIFVLGDSNRIYSNDGTNSTGAGDYALITDFHVSEDILQLAQLRPEQRFNADYVLGTVPEGVLMGVGLYVDHNPILGLSSNDALITVS